MVKEPKFLSTKKKTVIFDAILGCGDQALSCDCHSLEELVPNTSEGASEKHLPVIEVNGQHVTVKVGSVFHPMTEEHSIAWVYLFTKAGCCQRIYLDGLCDPVAEFVLNENDEPAAAYAYCNLHGFWKTEYK